MDFTDKTLTCADCGKEFVFSATEQEFYANKGFVNEPKRCQSCRQTRKLERGGRGGPRQMYKAVCAECGAEAEVPFQPSQDKPVYCSDCYSKRTVK